MPELPPVAGPRHCLRRVPHPVLLAVLCAAQVWFTADVRAADAVAIARIGDLTLTEADLSDGVRARQAKQKLDIERRRREIDLDSKLSEVELRTNDVEHLVNDRVLAQEAAARHTTPGALLEQLKVVAVTPDEARAVYAAHASEINQPYAAVEKPLID